MAEKKSPEIEKEVGKAMKKRKAGKIVMLKLKQMKPYANNAKIHTEKQIAKLRESIVTYGYKSLIEVDENNIILAGHGRLRALYQIDTTGMKEVQVLKITDFSESEKKAYRLIHNRLNLETGFDDDMLKEEFFALEGTDNFYDTGFERREIDNLIKTEEEIIQDKVDVGAYERLKHKTKIKQGEVYVLGDHRLMCGSSLEKQQIDKLIGSNEIDLVATDPPYNYKETKGAGIFKKQVMKVAEDIKEIASFEPEPFLNVISTLFDKRMNAFIFCNKDLVPNYLNFALANNFNFNILSWHKKTFIPLGGSHHYPDTEYCIYMSKKPIFNQGLSSEHYQKYWVENKDQIEHKNHPTAKPVKILSLQIRLCSNKEGIVLDPFGGSGSTLIACEQLNRKCFTMELDPVYCQVIIDRWEKFSGQKAQRA